MGEALLDVPAFLGVEGEHLVKEVEAGIACGGVEILPALLCSLGETLNVLQGRVAHDELLVLQRWGT